MPNPTADGKPTTDWDSTFCAISIFRTTLTRFLSEKQIASLSDEDMQAIAFKLEDIYYDGDFWSDLEEAVKLVRKDKRHTQRQGEGNA